MHMKKMFILALIVLGSAFQFAKPSLQVPIDNDVGYLLTPMDQQSAEVMNLADNITVTALDTWSPVVLDVEKSGINFMYAPQSSGQSEVQCSIIYRLSSTANTDSGIQPNNSVIRDMGGLDTGELFPRAGAMARHS
jgi:hypothetical protein